METKYTPEQIEEIKGRFQAASDYLQANDLQLAASIQKINLGNDIFADKLIPHLSDTRYTKKSETDEDVVLSPFAEKTDESSHQA